MLLKAIHWLFDCQNPMHLYGVLPVLFWYIFMGVCLSYFFGQEIPGLLRVHGMVPLTWVWRCFPRIIWFIIAAVGIWHFAVVTTHLK